MITPRRALLLSFAQKNSALVIQFLSSIVIARLLSPGEIGIFSVGAVIVAFSHVLRDLGMANYVIQERDLTTNRVRGAQAIALTISWSIALLLLALSIPAAWLYNETGVALTMQVLSISFLFLPLGAVTVALLVRRMQFNKLYMINTLSALAHAASAILLAWLGVGFVSLAWASVVGAVVTATTALAVRPLDQPLLPSLREWRHVFSVGSRLSGVSVLYELGQGGPELVAGRTLGFEAVAYYSRAVGAGMMALRGIVDSILPVAVSYFAGQARDDVEMKPSYLQALAYMAAIGVPAFACLALMAEPAITVLYGRNWLPAVAPLQILCIGFACLTLANIAGPLLVGSGLVSLTLRLHAVIQPTKVLLTVVGSTFGLVGVALAVATCDVVLSAYLIYCAGRHVSASRRELLRSILPGITLAGCATGAAAAALALATLLLGNVGALSTLALGGIAAASSWLLVLFALGHPIAGEFRRAWSAFRRAL